MRLRSLVLLVALAGATLFVGSAGAENYISGNTWERGRHYTVVDTMRIPALGRRTIYLTVPAGETGLRTGTDGAINSWYTASDAFKSLFLPTFRRIQRLQVVVGGTTASLSFFFYQADHRSWLNSTQLEPFVVHDIPAEADSIQVSETAGVVSTIRYVIW